MNVHNFMSDLVVAEDEFPEVANYPVVVRLPEGEFIPVKGIEYDNENYGLVIEVGYGESEASH